MDSQRSLRITVVPVIGLALALAASAPRNAHAGPVPESPRGLRV